MKPTVAFVAGALFLAGAAVSPRTGHAQTALEVVEKLNAEAMDAYHNMDIERAGSMLEEAVRVAQQGGITGPPLALTNLNLGVIYIGGLGDNQGGGGYFLVAICADPNVQLDPLTSTPDMQGVFAEARAQARSGNCPAGLSAAPTNTSPIAPGAATPAGGGYGPTTAMDNETPWDDRKRDADLGDFRPLFLDLSLTVGMAYINAGMKADREPPPNQVFMTQTMAGQNVYLPDPLATHQANEQVRIIMDRNAALPPGQMPMDPGMATLLLLPGSTDALRTAWVPDADSEDDVSRGIGGESGFGPYGGSCEADGILTGPALVDELGNNLFPSKYCVRVNSAGVATTAALRAAVGYFVAESIGLSLVTRLQFSAGEGSFSNMLFGPRVEFLITEPSATGFYASIFVGGTIGQIQLQPPTANDSPNSPWITSGMYGAHVGTNIRYRLHPNFGLIFGPEVDIQFPDMLFNIDLSLGVEGAL